MDNLLAKLDFIVSPATPIPAFEVGPENSWRCYSRLGYQRW